MDTVDKWLVALFSSAVLAVWVMLALVGYFICTSGDTTVTVIHQIPTDYTLTVVGK